MELSLDSAALLQQAATSRHHRGGGGFPAAASVAAMASANPLAMDPVAAGNIAISAHLANLQHQQQQHPQQPVLYNPAQIVTSSDPFDNTEYSDDVGFCPEDIDHKSEPTNPRSDTFYYEGQTTLVPTGPQLFQCTQCITAPFKSKSMLRTHILAAHDKVKRHFCRFCNYSNTFPILVDSHTNAHHTRTVLYECSDGSGGCDFETHSKWKYNNHRRRHSNKYSCFYCEGAFVASDRAMLEAHLNTAHSRAFLYSCDLCPYSTTTKSCLNVHVRHGHQQLRDFACGFCGLQFPLRVNLMNHVAMAHAGNKVWYKCEQCEYRSEKNRDVRKHVKTVHVAVKPFQCEHCSYATSFRSDLKNHVNARHTREVMYPCTQCSYQATTKHSLKCHIRNCHDTAKHLRCSFCTYTTPHKKTLHQHVSKYHASMVAAAAAVQVASNHLYHVQLPGGAQVATAGPLLQPYGDGRMMAAEVPEATRIKMDRVPATPDIGDDHVRRISEDAGAFHCIDCNFVGPTKEMLKAHGQHVHPTESPFSGDPSCPHCSHKANTKQSLRKHLFYVHDKIKNFGCRYCAYTSSGKSHVLKHVNAVHLKAVTFSCLLCDYRTTTKASLNKHVRAVHDKVKAFACHLCDYKSSSSSCLKNHVNTAHLKQIFACDRCDFQTHSTYAIKRHKKLKHGEGAVQGFKAEAVELDIHQGPPTQVPLPTHVPQQPSQLASAAAAIMMVSN